VSPGAATTEFRATKIGIAIGVVLQVIALVLEILPQIAGDASWLPKVALIGGVILQAAAIAGYQVSRGIAKAGAGGAGAVSVSITGGAAGKSS